MPGFLFHFAPVFSPLSFCDSNVTDGSEQQLEKHDLQSTSIEEGIIIGVKPLLENVDSSIRCNFESNSNVTDVSDSQLEKRA
jgi:hypothetical protein